MPTSPSFPPPSFGAARVEHDLLGDLTVPAAAYYGVQTVRALDNFQITGIPLSHFPQFVHALARKAQATGRGVAELVLEEGLLSPVQLADILRPENMTRPRRIPTLASN
jgi:aspartate ammonia-lyase